VEPRLRLLELGGQLEQQPVGAEASDELHAEGQTGIRPVQGHTDRGSSGQIGELGVRHPPDVVSDELVEHSRRCEQLSGPHLRPTRAALWSRLGDVSAPLRSGALPASE